MDAVIGYNDPSAIGAVIAARSAGKKLVVVGLNGTSDGLAAVKDGRLVATVRSESVSIGQELVRGAYLLATKQKLPATVVVVRPNLVTKANVNKLRSWDAQLKASSRSSSSPERSPDRESGHPRARPPSLMPEVRFATARALGVRVARSLRTPRDFSSVELTRIVLERIDGVMQLNAVVSMRPGRGARTGRARADAGRAAAAGGGLLGLPVTVKDSLEAEGSPVAQRLARARRARRARRDATVVRRLREAGAVIVAKTNVPEYTWSYETDNVVSGRTVHPLDPARTPGGSSGGEAALLGADASIVGIGTDGGGSIRVPSHYCGTVGLRPTAGSRARDGLLAAYSRHGHARHERGRADGALRRGRRAAAPRPRRAGRHRSLRRTRRRLSTPASRRPRFASGTTCVTAWRTPRPSTREAVVAAARALEASGCRSRRSTPPDVSQATSIFFGMMAADGGARARDDLAAAKGSHTDQMRRLLAALEGRAARHAWATSRSSDAGRPCVPRARLSWRPTMSSSRP